MAIKAISFDFWNTLFAEQPGGFLYYKSRRRELLARALSHIGPFSDDQIALACHQEAKSQHRMWSEEHRTPGARSRLDAILSILGVELEEGPASALATAFEEGILELPPVPLDGARELVESLSGRYSLGIISDTGFSPGRVLRRVLEDNGLLGAFDSFVFSDEAGRSKPHFQVFGQTAQTLGAEPDQIVHIGDLEPTDVTGAKNAGCFAIRFAGVTPMEVGEPTRADRVVVGLGEIPGLLDDL